MNRLITRLMPQGVTSDAPKLVAARGMRGFADGMVSVLLASYLTHLGFSAGQVGLLITGTLLGSAALTLAVGLLGGRLSPKQILLIACGLMLITGVGFASVTAFWPLMLVAVVGTLNPSGGDVSVFLPTEQSMLTETVDARHRTSLFARYTLTGTFAAAFGALSAGIPTAIAHWQHIDIVDAERFGFFIYVAVAIFVWLLYTGLTVSPHPVQRPRVPLEKSRTIVLKLSALFSLDSLGGGFVVQSLLALWLFERFDLSVATAGAIFFAAGLLAATSQLLSPVLAARIGLIRTMAYTHIPANCFLMLTALMPTAPLAIAMLLARMSLSQMDVPARQSYVMSVVPPEERTAAASVTNVPRSLAAAFAPALGGFLLSHTTFGWPLILGGGVKILYDVLLLRQFAHVKPPEEERSPVEA